MNLYLRLIWTWLGARFKPRISPGDEIEMRFRVWPNDLDVNGHMNNGRYMTITDLGVVEYFSRTGFLPRALKRGWRPVYGGSVISFRRGLRPFTTYTLRFAMVCWDERWSYLRFAFEHKGRTMAVGYAKGAVVGRDGIVGSRESFGIIGYDGRSPEFPASVQAWIAADQLILNED